MTAICGIIGTDGRPWTPRDLAGVRSMLAPLGPDGGGTWAGTAGRCSAVVGAALRSFTPEDVADAQPAHDAEAELVLVTDLSLYNRGELAPVLGLADKPSVPDSAFVLAAYRRWGRGMLPRLDGDFALVLVDRPRGGVLLARDHVGACPLVLHERPGTLAFASTALALTELEGVGHDLDAIRAAEFLAPGPATERTFVEGVRWLPPSTALWIDAHEARRWRWWAPSTDVVDLGSPHAHEVELRHALDGAVGARLRGRTGAQMSGGLDSTAVAATAARLVAPDPLPTYTSAPPADWSGSERAGWDADESPLVREIAAMHRNLEPRFLVIPRRAPLLDGHEHLWELGAGPSRDPCNSLWIQAARRQGRADGLVAVLTGNRGNMHLSADGDAWLAALVRAGRLVAVLREARAWRRASGDSMPALLRSSLLAPLLPPGALRRLRRITGRPGSREAWCAATSLRPEVLADLDLPRLLPVLDETLEPRAVELAASRVVLADQAESALVSAALTGVTFRDPTADRRLIEVALRQPEWVRRHDGISRAVVRGAMADRLPASVLHRTRRGEQVPEWLDTMTAARTELASELEALRDHALSRELIDTARLRALVDHWPDRNRRGDPMVTRDYRLVLLRALMVSRYLRWFEARAHSARLGARGRRG